MITTLKNAQKEICQEFYELAHDYRCLVRFLTISVLSVITLSTIPLGGYNLVFSQENSTLFYEIIQDYYYYLRWGSYWMSLGILSSIGFGTGLHTGMMFLFPWVIEVVYHAESCGHTNFPTTGKEYFQCENYLDTETIPDQYIVRTCNLFWKCFPTVFIWGVGTAFGEIPPFWISRASYLQGGENARAEIEKLYTEYPGSKWMLEWMNRQISQRAFLIIFLMASYPNALFDMCGMMSGFAGISFWTFIGATILGKAFIKSGSQLLFVILMNKSGPSGYITSKIVSSINTLLPKVATEWMNSNITTVQEYVPETRWIGFKQVWFVITTLMTLTFVVSCVKGKAKAWETRTKTKKND